MEKIYVKHYILGTYSEDKTPNYRRMDMSEVVTRYELVTTRIKRALLANHVKDPDKLITYSFLMLGEAQNKTYLRKERVDINLDMLRDDLVGFPWENWEWVEAFQPLVDVAGYTIVEIESEYPSFGPTPDAPIDYIQPCYRIYERGSPDWDAYQQYGKDRRAKREQPEEAVIVDEDWFSRVKTSLKENIPTVLAVATTIAAVTVLVKTANDSVTVTEQAAERSEEILRHIEDSIDDAIDMPQIVKVELGDDIEVIGTGRRTW